MADSFPELPELTTPAKLAAWERLREEAWWRAQAERRRRMFKAVPLPPRSRSIRRFDPNYILTLGKVRRWARRKRRWKRELWRRELYQAERRKWFHIRYQMEHWLQDIFVDEHFRKMWMEDEHFYHRPQSGGESRMPNTWIDT